MIMEAIGHLIKRIAREDFNNNYSRMSETLGLKGDKPIFERRRLSRFANGDQPPSINIDELQSLHDYEQKLGTRHPDGLGGIFALHTNLSDVIRKTGKITLLYGSSLGQTATTSIWDTRSIFEIVKRFSSCEFEFIDFNNLSGTHNYTVETVNRALETDGTVISIGAPISCPAAEHMLCQMFDVPRNGQKTSSLKYKLPFRYIWSNEAYRGTPTHFAKGYPKYTKRDPSGSDGWKTWGIEIEDQVHMLKVQNGVATTHGVVAVHYRSKKSIFIVAAGVTGPATLATVSAISDFQLESLPEKSNSMKIDWAPVKTWITQNPKEQIGDNRRLDGWALEHTRTFKR